MRLWELELHRNHLHVKKGAADQQGGTHALNTENEVLEPRFLVKQQVSYPDTLCH